MTANPGTVQVLQATSPKTAVWAGQTPATGAWVIEIDVRVSILLIVIGYVGTGVLRVCMFVEGGGWAVDIVYHKLDFTGAGVYVVMVEIVIRAHDRQSRA